MYERLFCVQNVPVPAKISSKHNVNNNNNNNFPFETKMGIIKTKYVYLIGAIP